MIEYSSALVGILISLIIYQLVLWLISRNPACLVYSSLTFFFLLLLYYSGFLHKIIDPATELQSSWVLIAYTGFTISLIFFSKMVLHFENIIFKYNFIQKWILIALGAALIIAVAAQNHVIYAAAYIFITLVGFLYYYFTVRALRQGQDNALIFLMGGTMLGISASMYVFHILEPARDVDLKRLLVLLSVGLGFTFYAITLFSTSNRMVFERHKETKELQLARLQALQHRMSPHFLFNSLNTIYAMMMSNTQKAQEALMDLADLYHFLADESSRTLIAIKQEQVFIQNFLNIMLSRLGNNLNVKQYWDESTKNIQIPPLTIQPIIENCFKHNMALTYALEIEIHVEKYEDGASISIVDNGSGLKTKNIKSKTLDNIRERLKYYYGDVSAQLSNRKNKKGAQVKLRFYNMSDK